MALNDEHMIHTCGLPRIPAPKWTVGRSWTRVCHQVYACMCKCGNQQRQHSITKWPKCSKIKMIWKKERTNSRLVLIYLWASFAHLFWRFFFFTLWPAVCRTIHWYILCVRHQWRFHADRLILRQQCFTCNIVTIRETNIHFATLQR